jgi:L-ribulose-5-phosphate 3-epimerase
VLSCCANYFMVHPFFRVPESERLQSIAVLNHLILCSAQLGIKTILIPVLENSEIRCDAERSLLIDSIQGSLALAANYGISLGLEAELPAFEYQSLVEQVSHPQLGIYYDTGNNTSLGYDITADAEILISRFVGIHIKDRKRGGPNVLLGQGDADFEGFFKVLKRAHYTGPLILETTFGQDPLEAARSHRKFVHSYLQ